MFTFIGLLIGLFTNGFFGGILGFIIGSIIDGLVFRRKLYRSQHHYSQQDFTEIILILTAEVMKSDGDVKTSELNYIKNYLRNNYSLDTAQKLLIKLRDILDSDYNVDAVCNEIRGKASIHEKLYILQFLFGVAGADGNFNQPELATIQRISDLMGVSRNDYESIKSMYTFSYWSQAGFGGGYTYSGSSSSFNTAQNYNLDNDYKILEIPSSATDEEVKKAYRNLAKKYHPDKVNHLGEEIRKDAEVKFTKLNQAYERIKKSRGMN